MSKYWWDRSGHDPDLAELERRLKRLSFRETRGSRGAPTLVTEGRPPVSRTSARWPRRIAGLAVAATLLVGLALWWIRPRPVVWEVIALHGSPRIGQVPIDGRAGWQPDQVVETGADGRVKILVADIGQVDVEPHSRVRFVDARPGNRRLALDRGTIRAFIDAPPRHFFVETPGAIAVDLGCAYSINVGDDDDGLLRVSFGWVAFESTEREVYVPAGAACALHRRTGPGTPYFEDASEGFRLALGRLDAAAEGAEGRGAALDALLREARPRDALTLIQLLRRLPRAEGDRVYERAAALLPPPTGVTPETVFGAHPSGYDLWWRQMGLGELKWRRIARRP
jgi:hypothetical protein